MKTLVSDRCSGMRIPQMVVASSAKYNPTWPGEDAGVLVQTVRLRSIEKSLDAFLSATYRHSLSAASETRSVVVTDAALNALICPDCPIILSDRVREIVNVIGGRLSLTRPCTHDPLHDAAANALNATNGAPFSFRIATPAENVFLLASVGKLDLEGVSVLRFFFLHPESRALPRRDALVAWFGLTPTQSALAIELASGRDVTEIARKRRLSTLTVRTHLRTIFEKTNTHTQRDLIALLVRLAAI